MAAKNQKWFYGKNAKKKAEAAAKIRTERSGVEYKVYPMLGGVLWVGTREQERKLTIRILF